jgi:hypothetical protein
MMALHRIRFAAPAQLQPCEEEAGRGLLCVLKTKCRGYLTSKEDGYPSEASTFVV